MKRLKAGLIFLILVEITLAQNTVGTVYISPLVQEGYTLFCPSGSKITYLIDNCGRVVNSWESDYYTGLSVYLLENGNLLRTCRITNNTFVIPGKGGRIEMMDWDGNMVWEYRFSDSLKLQHHDIEYLPNGNILILAVEYKSPAECYLAGRDPSNLSENKLFPEFLAEIKPIGADSGVIVWEWHMWDHLIQEFDHSLNNYGEVSEHPELFDINYVSPGGPADWAHANSVFYNPELDQIVVSLNKFNEFFIIDHSTTTIEAASHSGGTMGKGGDILYRYGNPAAYQHGSEADQQNFGQHTVYWIPPGYKDAGKIIFFNNGNTRGYSSVDIVSPLLDGQGNYLLDTDTAFGPDSAEWSYNAVNPQDFFSTRISSAQRLENGNILICEGRKGHFFELDSLKNIVWDYVSPIAGLILTQGDTSTPNSIFRCIKYSPNYPGLLGKDLTPGNPIELNPDISSCISIIATGNEEWKTKYDFEIFPNPTCNYVIISRNDNLNHLGEEIKLYNTFGKCVGIQFVKDGRIELGQFQKGVYWIKAYGMVKKIIKL